MKKMGNRIRALRKNKSLTLNDLAERAQISGGYLSEIERDRRQPAVDTLQAIAAALGTTVGYLMGETDNPLPIGIDEEAANFMKSEVIKDIATDPRKYAAAALISQMDEDQLRKAFDFLSDQKQLAELKRLKGA